MFTHRVVGLIASFTAFVNTKYMNSSLLDMEL